MHSAMLLRCGQPAASYCRFQCAATRVPSTSFIVLQPHLLFCFPDFVRAGAASCDKFCGRLGMPGLCITGPTSPIMPESTWALRSWLRRRALLRYARPCRRHDTGCTSHRGRRYYAWIEGTLPGDARCLSAQCWRATGAAVSLTLAYESVPNQVPNLLSVILIHSLFDWVCYLLLRLSRRACSRSHQAQEEDDETEIENWSSTHSVTTKAYLQPESAEEVTCTQQLDSLFSYVAMAFFIARGDQLVTL